MKIKNTIIFIFLISQSIAQEQGTVLLKIGSTGIGAGYEKMIKPKWSTSASLTYMNLSPSILLRGSEYQHRLKGTAQFVQLELAVKWFPRTKTNIYGDTKSDRFYLKGGLLIRNNGKYVILSDYQTLKSTNQFDANDPNTGKLNINLTTNVVQPFLALGFKFTKTNKRLYTSIETGLSYHGTSPTIPFINFYETGNIKLLEPNFNNWVRVPKLIRLVKVYPLLNFNIGWDF